MRLAAAVAVLLVGLSGCISDAVPPDCRGVSGEGILVATDAPLDTPQRSSVAQLHFGAEEVDEVPVQDACVVFHPVLSGTYDVEVAYEDGPCTMMADERVAWDGERVVVTLLGDDFVGMCR